MKIKIQDKEFKIELVNNYVHQLYEEIKELSIELIGKSDFLQAQLTEYSKNPDREKKKSLDLDLDEFNKFKNEKRKEIAKLRMEIIEEVLTTNNYNFEEKWWLRRTEPDDLNNFMLACIQKDAKTEGKKQDTKK